MNRRINALYLRAKGDGQCLMTQADTKQRQRAVMTGGDQINGDAGIFGYAGARRNDQTLRLAGDNIGHAAGVIAPDFNLSPEIRQKMPQIPCKTVVIIDQDEHAASF
jgi:hypothetical protein